MPNAAPQIPDATFAPHPTRRQQAAERAALIAQLGWAPEPGIAAERYCATSGQLFQLVAEKFGLEVAENCRVYAMPRGW